MPSSEVSTVNVEAAESTPEFIGILKLLSHAVALFGSAPAALTEIQSWNDSAPPSPDTLTRWTAELSPFVHELRAAREARRQKALAAVSAARLDQVTGLPGISAAVGELEKNLANGEAPLVAVLVLDQLRAFNARFGRAIGDEVLALAAGELSQQLAETGKLYRWNGPAFLLVSNMTRENQDELDLRLREIATKRIEKTVAYERRAIHVKITFSWHMVALQESGDVIETSRALDDFVAARMNNAAK